MEELTPICIYKNLISLPIKNIEKESVFYSCDINSDFIGLFYSINAYNKPYPAFADLFCVFNLNKKTVKITPLYDPYDVDINCSLRIMGWQEPTPFSTPIYLFLSDANDIVFSKIKLPLKKYEIEVIHLLENDNFLFSQSFGKCVPSKIGTGLNECSIDFIINGDYKGNYPNVISFLEKNYGGKKEKKKYIILIIIFISSVLFFIFWKIFFELRARLKASCSCSCS